MAVARLYNLEGRRARWTAKSLAALGSRVYIHRVRRLSAAALGGASQGMLLTQAAYPINSEDKIYLWNEDCCGCPCWGYLLA